MATWTGSSIITSQEDVEKRLVKFKTEITSDTDISLSEHTSDTEIHVSEEDRSSWDSKLTSDALAWKDEDTVTTAESGGNLYWSTAIIDKRYIPTGKLKTISIPFRSNVAQATVPAYLGVQTSTDGSTWEDLTISQNSVTDEAATTGVWEFNGEEIPADAHVRIFSAESRSSVYVDRFYVGGQSSVRDDDDTMSCLQGSSMVYQVICCSITTYEEVSIYSTVEELEAHVEDVSAHVTDEERDAWNAKAETDIVTGYATEAYVDSMAYQTWAYTKTSSTYRNIATGTSTVFMTNSKQMTWDASVWNPDNAISELGRIVLYSTVDAAPSFKLYASEDGEEWTLVDENVTYTGNEVLTTTRTGFTTVYMLSLAVTPSESLLGKHIRLVGDIELVIYYSGGVSTDVTGNVTDADVEQTSAVLLADFYKKATVASYVEEAVAAIDIPEVDLSGYATEDYVGEAIAAIEFPEVDLTGYATEEYVAEGLTYKTDGSTFNAYVNETADILAGKVSTATLTEHTNDSVSHVTASERTSWNAKISELPAATTTVAGVVKLLSSYQDISTTTAATPYAVYAVYQFVAANTSAIGTLSDLTTTEQGSLVGAVNELNSALSSCALSGQLPLATSDMMAGWTDGIDLQAGYCYQFSALTDFSGSVIEFNEHEDDAVTYCQVVISVSTNCDGVSVDWNTDWVWLSDIPTLVNETSSDDKKYFIALQNLNGTTYATWLGGSSSGGGTTQQYITTTPASDLVLTPDTVTDIGVLTEDTDLSGLTVAGSDTTVATAEVWLTTGETVYSVTWSEAMIWLSGTSEGSAPTLETETQYCIAIQRRPNGQYVANVISALSVTSEEVTEE